MFNAIYPLVEGTTVSTKYGMVKTDHILFIASGAFHLNKPSDLIPELQGASLSESSCRLCRWTISKPSLTQPTASLIKAVSGSVSAEGVTLSFTPEAIKRLV